MLNNHKNLKEKLEAALNKFKVEGDCFDFSKYKAEHDAMVRISKTLTKIQSNIDKDETYLQAILNKKEEYVMKIKSSIKRMHKSVFDDLIAYKNLNESSQVDDILNDYGIDKCSDNITNSKVQGLGYDDNCMIINRILKLFRKSIECDEILLYKLKELDSCSEKSSGFASLNRLDLKAQGLDPRFYKYHSSSDDTTPDLKQEIVIPDANSYSCADTSLLSNKTINDENSLGFIEEAEIRDKEIIVPDKDFTEKELKSKLHQIMKVKEDDEKIVFESKVNQVRDEIQKIEDTHRMNLQTEHGLKERVHLILRKMYLNKLEMTENLLERLENRLSDEINMKSNILGSSTMNSKKLEEEDRIKSILLKMYKEINKTKRTPEEIDLNHKIEKYMIKLSRNIVEDKGKINDYILSTVNEVICQGTLEDDNRFLEKLNRQLKDIEEKSEPRYFKISVNMEIAKKYVKDIIHLKKKNLLMNYYNFS